MYITLKGNGKILFLSVLRILLICEFLNFTDTLIPVPKMPFRFLNKFKYEIRKKFDFCFYTEVEILNIKLNGYSILKITEH